MAAAETFNQVETHLNQAILGQQALIRQFLVGLLAGGHLLLEGLPGLGKTQLVRAFSELCGLVTRRIQFTPDLMPLDITGAPILKEVNGKREFEFSPGAIFANIVLADEINRASPKTQSALLEAMQERQVTILGVTYRLPTPFAVLATQNPIELEGTYPLPEAQLDRFLFKLEVSDVPADILEKIITNLRGELPVFPRILGQEEFVAAKQAVSEVQLSAAVANYIARLVVMSRPGQASEFGRFIKFGASPRAGLGIASASRAESFLAGRDTVGFEDVKAVIKPVLRHRLILDYQAKLENITVEMVIDDIIKSTSELQRTTPHSLAEKFISASKSQ